MKGLAVAVLVVFSSGLVFGQSVTSDRYVGLKMEAAINAARLSPDVVRELEHSLGRELTTDETISLQQALTARHRQQQWSNISHNYRLIRFAYVLIGIAGSILFLLFLWMASIAARLRDLEDSVQDHIVQARTREREAARAASTVVIPPGTEDDINDGTPSVNGACAGGCAGCKRSAAAEAGPKPEVSDIDPLPEPLFMGELRREVPLDLDAEPLGPSPDEAIASLETLNSFVAAAERLDRLARADVSISISLPGVDATILSGVIPPSESTKIKARRQDGRKEAAV